ncbi:MAG TPA: hypothetical protein VKN35_13215, partial [Xanthomonadales bacterium]|nr:hypothetical protein [Xanthomonadales bacterium]
MNQDREPSISHSHRDWKSSAIQLEARAMGVFVLAWVLEQWVSLFFVVLEQWVSLFFVVMGVFVLGCGEL